MFGFPTPIAKSSAQPGHERRAPLETPDGATGKILGRAEAGGDCNNDDRSDETNLLKLVTRQPAFRYSTTDSTIPRSERVDLLGGFSTSSPQKCVHRRPGLLPLAVLPLHWAHGPSSAAHASRTARSIASVLSSRAAAFSIWARSTAPAGPHSRGHARSFLVGAGAPLPRLSSPFHFENTHAISLGMLGG